LVTDLRIRTEVPYESQVDDGRGTFRAKDVLEFPPAQIEHVNANPARVTFPGNAIHTDDLEKIPHAAGDQTALPTGYARDEKAVGGHCFERRIVFLFRVVERSVCGDALSWRRPSPSLVLFG
jgi:hypothetical protein